MERRPPSGRTVPRPVSSSRRACATTFRTTGRPSCSVCRGAVSSWRPRCLPARRRPGCPGRLQGRRAMAPGTGARGGGRGRRAGPQRRRRAPHRPHRGPTRTGLHCCGGSGRQAGTDLARRSRTPEVAGRATVIVDDGLATGATALAAAQVVRALSATVVVLAVPVAPADTDARLDAAVDSFVALARPRRFGAVGTWYEDFRQVEDDDVRALLGT